MRGRHALPIILALVLIPVSAGALGLESYLFGFQEAWTGNGYVPSEGFDVTGSEGVPLDAFVSFGVRFGILDGFLAENAILAFHPSAQLGYRYYLLYQSGLVVPTQIETAYGAEGSTRGVGSSRVITLRVPLPVAYELRFNGGSAAWMSISPTLVARIPAGDRALLDESENLSAMYSFFYGRMRFLMPEIAVGYRFPLSDHLEAGVSVTYGVSVLDLFNTDLPWYDQMRASISVNVGVIPPFSGLIRDREAEQQLPPGVEPFPAR